MSVYILAALSVISGAIGVYIAASFNLAQKQLLAATRLRAYLMYYARVVIDMDWFNILYLGQQWDDEELDILRKGGKGAELQLLKENKKQLCNRIIEAMRNPENLTDEHVAALKFCPSVKKSFRFSSM